MPTKKKLDKTCASFLLEKNGTWDFAQSVVDEFDQPSNDSIVSNFGNSEKYPETFNPFGDDPKEFDNNKKEIIKNIDETTTKIDYTPPNFRVCAWWKFQRNATKFAILCYFILLFP